MPCYKPLKAYKTRDGIVFAALKRHDIQGELELPCGQCIGCRMRRASDWSLRVMHEAQLWQHNCFVTLTYAPGNLPAEGSLEHRDFQLFIKRLRKRHNKPVRFYMAGEYGPETQRPHYHACLFNRNFYDRKPAGTSESGAEFFDSEELTEIWGLGRASVQDLTAETASYCARYIMKKVLGHNAENAYDWIDKEGEVHKRKPEYAAMSLKPGIGAEWFKQYQRDVFPSDTCVQNGVIRQTPKYYDQLAKETALDTDLIQYKRQQRAAKHQANNTPERLKVRETVQLAKTETLKRHNI